jgi:hypothetical protein
VHRALGARGGPGKRHCGTDCGFASGAAYLTVYAEIAWLKLRSLVEGACLASSRLR